jgi:hypothetical protein
MKKILFTLEIALFLLTLPVVLGLAMSREIPVDNKSEKTVPVVKQELQANTLSVATPATINKAS